MNPLTRLYEAISYRLVKWWITRKARQFRKCPEWTHEWKALIAYYDEIYGEA